MPGLAGGPGPAGESEGGRVRAVSSVASGSQGLPPGIEVR